MTPTPRTVSTDVEQTVIRELLKYKTVGTVAMDAGVSRRVVEEIAAWAGHPDRERLQAALGSYRDGSGTVGAQTVRELRRVALDDLHPDPANAREVVGNVDDLAASMAEVGLIQPVVARKSGPRLIIVAGHRRHAAARQLGWTDIDTVITAAMQPDEVLAAQLVENGQRAGLDPIEEARALNRIRATGLTSKQVGKRVGRSQSWVDARLALLELPADVQMKVRLGEIGIGQAVHRSRVDSGKVRRGAGRWHLAEHHPLASRVRARCKLTHPTGANKVGSVGCGECWESVIRADERRLIEDAYAAADAAPGDGWETFDKTTGVPA